MADRRTGGVGHYVINRGGGNGTGDIEDMKAQQQSKRNILVRMSNGSFDRRKVAEEARINPGQTKSGFLKRRTSDYPANVPSSATQGTNGHLSNPASQSTHTVIKQEHSRRQADMHDPFDTDAENIDDTSTMSIDVQVKDSQSQANAHLNMPLQANGTRRAPDLPRSSAISAERVYAEEDHGRSAQDTYQEHEEGLDDEYSQDGESEYTEGEELTEDPTLNREAMKSLKSLKSLTIRGMLQDKDDGEEFRAFLGEPPQAFRNTSLFPLSQVPAKENAVRPSSQSNRRPLQEKSSENQNQSTLRNAGSEGRAQAQSPPKAGVSAIPTQPVLYPNHGRHPDTTASPARVHKAGDARPIEPKRRMSSGQAGKPQVSFPNFVTTSPQQPTKVQGAEFEAGEPSSEMPAPTPLNDGFTEYAGDFTQEQLELGHKRALEPDYSEEDLSRMAYNELESEPYDHDPKAPPSVLPAELQSQTLERQLAHIIDLPNPADEHTVPEHQRFFASLPIDKYEECGDLILEKFGEIMNKFKKARQDKRQISRDFEDEVSKREALVSARVDALDKDMGRLRKAGQEVIRGKGV